MSCFSCFTSHEDKKALSKRNKMATRDGTHPSPPPEGKKETRGGEVKTQKDENNNKIAAQTFTFRELAAATKNFRQECLIGEGGFGRVYKGRLETTGQAEPYFRDQSKIFELLDPLLKGNAPKKSFRQAAAIATMCLEEDPEVRPLMTDVVSALSHLSDELKSKSEDSSHEEESPKEDNKKKKNGGLSAEEERQRAVAEAIEWGANSRNQQA
ncbi:hypothetical protein DM860_012022 [Cuscuta australis]|uniref:Protein kinase domain-containing protein n=1 Tax=Cuscuta australis TaxID=267555 RepID=A0A328DDG2_9ASTE|nr:hypothetical protein DM860_012022 [Cuscuta australis]